MIGPTCQDFECQNPCKHRWCYSCSVDICESWIVFIFPQAYSAIIESWIVI